MSNHFPIPHILPDSRRPRYRISVTGHESEVLIMKAPDCVYITSTPERGRAHTTLHSHATLYCHITCTPTMQSESYRTRDFLLQGWRQWHAVDSLDRFTMLSQASLNHFYKGEGIVSRKTVRKHVQGFTVCELFRLAL